MKNRKAIITLAIGEKYLSRWNHLCFYNWQKYADRQGYDVICIDNFLDKTAADGKRRPNWEKCLILGDDTVKRYEQVVWVDSDILINPDAPCICASVPVEKVGAVEMFTGPLAETLPGQGQSLVDRAKEFWCWPFRDGYEFYANSGLPDQFDQVVQTGVMVLSPAYHREILEHVYFTYDEPHNGHAEMECLSYELVKSGLMQWLDPRFNRLWIECMLRDYPFLLPSQKPIGRLSRVWKQLVHGQYQKPSEAIANLCLQSAFINNYFLHFAGTVQFMGWFDAKVENWHDLRGRV